MTKRKAFTTMWCVITPGGTLNDIKFGDHSNDREIGRTLAHKAALKMKDHWSCHAPYISSDDITIVER